MRNGYNIVAVTAAGRRQYMKFLIPHILKSDMIDRYDIWVNTMSKLDIAFFKELENKYSKVNLVSARWKNKWHSFYKRLL